VGSSDFDDLVHWWWADTTLDDKQVLWRLTQWCNSTVRITRRQSEGGNRHDAITCLWCLANDPSYLLAVRRWHWRRGRRYQ